MKAFGVLVAIIFYSIQALMNQLESMVILNQIEPLGQSFEPSNETI